MSPFSCSYQRVRYKPGGLSVVLGQYSEGAKLPSVISDAGCFNIEFSISKSRVKITAWLGADRIYGHTAESIVEVSYWISFPEEGNFF